MRRTAHATVLVAIVLGALATQPGIADQDSKLKSVAGHDSKLTVLVVGDVLYPGEYPLTPEKTALDYLTLAGGSPQDSIDSLIVRRNAKTGDGQEIKFDPNGHLRSNDLLIVRGVYALRPDEVLQIEVEGNPRLSGRYIIQEDKSVILPTGERLIVGKDPEFQRHIANALTAKIEGAPKITVTVARPRGPRTEGR